MLLGSLAFWPDVSGSHFAPRRMPSYPSVRLAGLRRASRAPSSSSDIVQSVCGPLAEHPDKAPGNSIRHIVMAAWSMIDAVPAAAARAPLEAAELRGKALLVEEIDLTRVQAWKQVAVEIALGRAEASYLTPYFLKTSGGHSPA